MTLDSPFLLKTPEYFHIAKRTHFNIHTIEKWIYNWDPANLFSKPISILFLIYILNTQKSSHKKYLKWPKCFWPLLFQFKPPSCFFDPRQDPLLYSFSPPKYIYHSTPKVNFKNIIRLCQSFAWFNSGCTWIKKNPYSIIWSIRPSMTWLLPTLCPPLPILPLIQITPTEPTFFLILK